MIISDNRMIAQEIQTKSLPQADPFKKLLFIGIVGLGLLALASFVRDDKLAIVVVAVVVLALTVLAFRRIEVITLGVILMLYINLPVVIKKSLAMFQLFSLSLYVLLCVPLAVYIFSRREKLRVDRIFILLLAFLLTAIVSSFFAKDMSLAVEWILTFLLEGVILYFLILNLVRNLEILKKVIWVLMLGASLLGSLSLYQELTHSYENKFYGLAQRNTEEGTGEENTTSDGKLLRTRTEVNLANRASGSLGGPNRYAQIMLMILPLALFTFWRERSLKLKLTAALATILILSGVTLSYSRGAFVTLMLLLALLTMMRYIRVSKILTLVLVLIPIVAAVAPGYLVRMETILGVEGLFAQSTTRQPDAVTRGRLTEMLAAFHCFLDHPIFGVGPGQFTPFYSIEYMQDPDIALRGINKTRRAHVLYFELAAETGIIGVTIFLAMVILVMNHLLQQRRYWSERYPDLANIATALFLSIVSYLGTAIFLHLSYQRYYWLLLGLVGATLKIFSVAAHQTTGWIVSDSWQHATPAALRIEDRQAAVKQETKEQGK